MNSVANPPLACELLLADNLGDHLPAFRSWVETIGGLTRDALLSSSTIESCSDLFDKRRWDTAVSTGEPPNPRLRRLSARSWAGITSTDELRGLGIDLQPLPRTPERSTFQSTISLETTWYSGFPNRVTYVLPARYCARPPMEWSDRLVDAFKALGRAVSAQTGYIAWTNPMQHLRHPLGAIDFTSTVMESGWALLLRDTHIDRVGGLTAVRSSGLFEKVEPLSMQSGAPLHYLQVSAELPSPGSGHQQRDEARLDFLRPLLLP